MLRLSIFLLLSSATLSANVLSEVSQADLTDACTAGESEGCASLQLLGVPWGSPLLQQLHQNNVKKDANECLVINNSTSPPFSKEEVKRMKAYLLRNVDVDHSGETVASPDHFTGEGGDYFYSWARDSALVASALLRTAELEEVDTLLVDYVISVRKLQDTHDPNPGVDIRVEPKFTIPNGQPYTGAWCRPQDDGPGLRAKALAEYGRKLLKRGNKSFVKEHLLTGDTEVQKGGVIARDLDWVAEHWREESCDLWEELRSNDFFWNRYTMRAGLFAGAKLADELDMTEVAQKYLRVIDDIEATLRDHYDGTYVFETGARRKDAAVIEAFNVGDLNDEFFSPLSKEVLRTVVTLNELFCRTFEVNKRDSQEGVPGILYGRYEGDHYHGGNAWVLTSAALARLIYKQARAAVEADLSHETYALLEKAYGVQPSLTGQELGAAILAAGDGVLLRIRHHAEDSGLHMAEQINRATGKMESAKDLTWNYANILLAMQARDAYGSSKESV